MAFGFVAFHCPVRWKLGALFGWDQTAAIKPFRYLIIYPAMTRQWEGAWRDRNRHSGSGADDTVGSAGADSLR